MNSFFVGCFPIFLIFFGELLTDMPWSFFPPSGGSVMFRILEVMRKSSHVSCENYNFWVPRRSQAKTPRGCKKRSMKHFQTWNGLSALRVFRTTPVSIETFAFHIWISLGHLWLMHPFQDVDTYDILRSTLDTWKWTSTTTKTQVLQREILVCCRKFPLSTNIASRTCSPSLRWFSWQT